MKIVFSDMPMPTEVYRSIFLAGPSPRQKWNDNWRYKAVEILEEFGFDGTVFIPIPSDKWCRGMDDEEKIIDALVSDNKSFDYDNQIWWEVKARQISDVILFWVDRSFAEDRLALTTNIEFGEDLATGKMVYGRPDDAPKCKYLDRRFVEAYPLRGYGSDLVDVVSSAMFYSSTFPHKREALKRYNGEVNVPKLVWETEQFQSWYRAQKAVGNRLDDAKVLHVKTVSNGDVFSFVLWVNMWIAAENRNKENEFIFSRTDISSIIPYYRDGKGDVYIALVKEYRSAVNNKSGFVYELPGGSAPSSEVDPRINAQSELKDELGINIEDITRFEQVDVRQLCSTICTHRSHLFAVELTWGEYTRVLQDKWEGKTHGLAYDTEVTYPEIVALSDLLCMDLDYSMLGMILSYFHKN